MSDIVFAMNNLKLIYLYIWIEIIYPKLIFWNIYIYIYKHGIMEQKNQDILQKQKCFFFKKKQNIKVTELTSLIKISTSQFPQFTEKSFVKSWKINMAIVRARGPASGRFLFYPSKWLLFFSMKRFLWAWLYNKDSFIIIIII